MGFAIMGSFEDAMDGWRHHAENFQMTTTASYWRPLLAPSMFNWAVPHFNLSYRVAAGTGRSPEIAHFAQVVGLVWRTVVMWLVLVALFRSLANLLG
jgi:adenosylcobinamide-phosphate synthase